MKKIIKFAAVILVMIMVSAPLTAMAQELETIEAPTVTEVSFNNAKINEKFLPTKSRYTITLSNPNLTPTLKDYKINGSAKLFVTYSQDESKKQNGIILTLEFDGGSTVYTFDYSNAEQYEKNSNNNLTSIDCYLGEVYPQLNDKDTDYKLYVPNDLTSIKLTAVTQDVGAHCDAPAEITLTDNQEPTITLTVTASDSTVKLYNLKVKRINKTSAEVEEEMKDPHFKSIVEGELFYQKPIFFISIVSTVCGIAIICLFVILAKRLTVKVDDEEEKEFFDIV